MSASPGLLPWQQAHWQTLTSGQRPAQAWLLHGPVGSGKRLLADHFAQWSLCRQPTEQACGQCPACQLYQAQTHPDLFLLQPEESGKAIPIAAVRDLVHSVQQTAQQGGRRVVIVEPAEAMTIEASNALLKSLEEPGSGTLFVLVSHQPGFLLPTIRSRCLLLACPLPALEQARQWLQQQQPELNDQQLQQVLQLAAGSPLRAQTYVQDNVLQQHAEVITGVKQLLKREAGPTELASRWASLPPVRVLEWFSGWNQALVRLLVAPEEEASSLAEMQPVLGYMARFAQLEAVFALQDWIHEKRHKLLRRAPLRQDLLLESLLTRWLELIQR